MVSKEKTITVNDLMIQGVVNVLNDKEWPRDFDIYYKNGFLICGRIIKGRIEDSIENIISFRNKISCKSCMEAIDQWLNAQGEENENGIDNSNS